MLLVFVLGVVFAVPVLLLAMVITSKLGGGVEFGNVGMVVLKCLPVLAIAHALFMVPFGFVLAFGAMMVGFMIAFRLDIWEARMLVIVNWALNFGLRLALVAALA
jgi:hypothetical protein